MKLLFLDFDGVMNSAQSAIMYSRSWINKGRPAGRSLLSKNNWELCPLAVSNLSYLLEKIPDLKIVISSTWRYGEQLSYFKEMFEVLALPPDAVIGMTPRLNGQFRGLEIQKWLDDNTEQYTLLMPDTKFVILDDDSDMAHLMPNLIQTNYLIGFSHIELNKVLKFFTGEEV